MSNASLIPAERIERRIHLLRGQKVLLDFQLAELYEVETKALNQAVKRNFERFPEDFMFQLSEDEMEQVLRSQIVTSSDANRSQFVTGSQKHRDPKLPPYAFTEHGVAMLSSVLRSPRAVQVNIAIMRTFVQLRQMLAANKDLSRRLDQLESTYDEQFKVVFDAIRELMDKPEPLQPEHGRKIGFHAAGSPRTSKSRRPANRSPEIVNESHP
jgi:hypothetical protein